MLKMVIAAMVAVSIIGCSSVSERVEQTTQVVPRAQTPSPTPAPEPAPAPAPPSVEPTPAPVEPEPTPDPDSDSEWGQVFKKDLAEDAFLAPDNARYHVADVRGVGGIELELELSTDDFTPILIIIVENKSTIYLDDDGDGIIRVVITLAGPDELTTIVIRELAPGKEQAKYKLRIRLSRTF